MARYITETAGLRKPYIEIIDGLLELLPDRPQFYVERGRLQPMKVEDGALPHSHTTGAAADLILDMWRGTGPLAQLISHASGVYRLNLARALRACADALEEGVG